MRGLFLVVLLFFFSVVRLIEKIVDEINVFIVFDYYCLVKEVYEFLFFNF